MYSCRIRHPTHQNYVLLHIEHNVKTTHSAVTINKQDSFALLYKSNGKTNADG